MQSHDIFPRWFYIEVGHTHYFVVSQTINLLTGHSQHLSKVYCNPIWNLLEFVPRGSNCLESVLRVKQMQATLSDLRYHSFMQQNESFENKSN